MTLAELAVSYRSEADAIRLRIKLVEQLPTHSRKEDLRKQARLQILGAMLRDARDVANICAHYYDRDYRRSARYLL